MSSNLYDELPAEAAPLPTPSRALTIGAHPDDAEFGSGATLARWAADGTTVVMCVLTDGSKGSWDPAEPVESLIARRHDEQRRAAETLGAETVVHLDRTDGQLVFDAALRDGVAELIREHRPEVVLGHDPWQRYQLHPDHRAAGWALVDGIVRAREPRVALPSGRAAHRPGAVLLWSADDPDHAEPITDHWFDLKVEALLCHASQAATTMGDADRGADERDAFVRRMRDWQIQAGARLGGPPAETFKRLTP